MVANINRVYMRWSIDIMEGIFIFLIVAAIIAATLMLVNAIYIYRTRNVSVLEPNDY
jgi:hypothetical protein